MAKDGTGRGGARPGAGRKKKPLAERIQEGKKATVMKQPDYTALEGIEMPKPRDFLRDEQRQGELVAEDIYKEVWEWLRDRGCAELVNPQLLERYAMSAARWVQMEGIISEYGFIAKHPTTGAPIQAPFVSIANSYMKQANQLWYQIYQIVQENCSERFNNSPQDTLMERLLDARRGG